MRCYIPSLEFLVFGELADLLVTEHACWALVHVLHAKPDSRQQNIHLCQ